MDVFQDATGLEVIELDYKRTQMFFNEYLAYEAYKKRCLEWAEVKLLSFDDFLEAIRK